jgi:glycosyltransferase involved in cell wall biosynthesis
MAPLPGVTSAGARPHYDRVTPNPPLDLPGVPLAMPADLLCFSHLRWDFVYQRPNHLMSRAARERRVYFVEEPVTWDWQMPGLRRTRRDGVHVITPQLPRGMPRAARVRATAALVDRLVREDAITRPVLWYYTPMALPWTRQLQRSQVVYDSMDHLSGFKDADPDLLVLESELLASADLVFTGGASLHERMFRRHRNAHCFPSSVDATHFRRARVAQDPPDQRQIGRPRIGYAGVIDERIDLDLIGRVAAERPDWNIILLGPLAKIDPDDVPRGPNIHALGMKPYAELPAYLGGWSIGWMPFARNAATRYISPTKTPEYLAAGLPVVSTSIRDVVEPYGSRGLACIADAAFDTIAAMEAIMAGARPATRDVDAFLAARSWDRTWADMAHLLGLHSHVPADGAVLTDMPGDLPRVTAGAA